MDINTARRYYNLGMCEALSILDTYNKWNEMFRTSNMYKIKKYSFKKGELLIISSGISVGKSLICK